MAKTLISRLDDENIVRAAVDPDTHEATGDVYDSVNDVSYPFGGGGSSYSPTFTMKVLNTTSDTVYIDGLTYMDEPNNILVNDALPIEAPSDIAFEPNIEKVVNGVYAEMQISESETITYCVSINYRVQNTKIQTPYVTVSEMVNCELLTIEDFATIVKPIDTTIPASFKLTVAMEGSK